MQTATCLAEDRTKSRENPPVSPFTKGEKKSHGGAVAVCVPRLEPGNEGKEGMDSGLRRNDGGRRSTQGRKGGVWADAMVTVVAAGMLREGLSYGQVADVLRSVCDVEVSVSQIYRLKKELGLVKEEVHRRERKDRRERPERDVLGADLPGSSKEPEREGTLESLSHTTGTEPGDSEAAETAEAMSEIYSGIREEDEGLTAADAETIRVFESLELDEPEDPPVSAFIKEEEETESHGGAVPTGILRLEPGNEDKEAEEGDLVPFEGDGPTCRSSSPDTCACGQQSPSCGKDRPSPLPLPPGERAPEAEDECMCKANVWLPPRGMLVERQEHPQITQRISVRRDGGRPGNGRQDACPTGEIPAAAAALMSRYPVEGCQIKGLAGLSKVACLKRQVCGTKKRYICKGSDNRSEKMLNTPYLVCRGCRNFLSDEDYTAMVALVKRRKIALTARKGWTPPTLQGGLLFRDAMGPT